MAKAPSILKPYTTLEPYAVRPDRNLMISTELTTAFPVLVRGLPGLQRGFVRNINSGSILIQLEELPPLNSQVEITFSGIEGSSAAPESLTLQGEVRHHHVYRYTNENQEHSFRAVAIRFLDVTDSKTSLPA